MLLGLRMAELSKEIEIGRRIQQSLLPSCLPSVPGLDVASRCAMAHAMGGDFYDAVACDGKLRAVIADVSGHDLGAALFMAAARAQFHAELVGRRGPGALATRMNALLHSDLARAGLFATYFALSIDPRRGILRFASGGHNPALLLHASDGGVELLEATGTPLGIVQNARIAERSRRLAPGDLVLLYTDGLTETAAPDGALFGEERLADALARRRGLRAQEILAGVEEEIARFRGGAAATDDGTALLIQVEGPVRPKTG
jgi:sigma-B regulation protein RsbU (phosphoserine phosphatase)